MKRICPERKASRSKACGSRSAARLSSYSPGVGFPYRITYVHRLSLGEIPQNRNHRRELKNEVEFNVTVLRYIQKWQLSRDHPWCDIFQA